MTGSKGFDAQANELRQVFKEQEAIHQKRVAKEQVDAENESKAVASSDEIAHRIPDLEDDAYDPTAIAKQMTLIEEKVRIAPHALTDFITYGVYQSSTRRCR